MFANGSWFLVWILFAGVDLLACQEYSCFCSRECVFFISDGKNFNLNFSVFRPDKLRFQCFLCSKIKNLFKMKRECFSFTLVVLCSCVFTSTSQAMSLEQKIREDPDLSQVRNRFPGLDFEYSQKTTSFKLHLMWPFELVVFLAFECLCFDYSSRGKRKTPTIVGSMVGSSSWRKIEK